MKLKFIAYLFFMAMISTGLVGCGQEEVKKQPQVIRPVKTIVIVGNEAFNRTYPGKVQGAQSVNISFRVSGPLLKLPAKEGDQVKAGDLLAKMDSRDYDIALIQAKAEFNKSDADYKRYQKLYEKDAVALADLDLYRSKRDVANAKLEDAQSAVKDTTLRAPFDGQIGRIFVDNYQEVNARQDILSIYDSKNIEIIIDLPENVVARFKKGDEYKTTASFEVAPNSTYNLKLKEFSTQADATTQTYQATLMMPSPKDITILPGMTASVHLKIDMQNLGENATIAIPSIAVFPGDSGESFVWVVDASELIVNKRQIKVGGITGAASIEVFEGLKSGDRVVTAGIKQLREGMQVTLLN